MNLNAQTTLPFSTLPTKLGSLAAFQIAPCSPLFACSAPLPSTPMTSITIERPSVFTGGVASMPVEPSVGQIPEDMTAFNSFLTNMRRLEALFSCHNSTFVTMPNA